MCDFGHAWTVFRNLDDEESPQEAVCPHGHEAVTLKKCRMLDYVQVSIRPAAQIVDDVTKRVGHEYEFYVVASDLHSGEERSPANPYTWTQALALMERLRNVSPDRAWKLLDAEDRARR